MGAWGIRAFDNDGAMDWLGDFLGDPSEGRILDAFSAESAIVQPGLVGKLMGKKPQEFPAELDGENVLAAAEVVAAISGMPADSNSDELKNLPNISLRPETSTKALEAIDAIMTGSNLKDCWEETDDFEQWKADVNDLRQRLASSGR